MGVRGLSSYLYNDPRNFQFHELHDTLVIVDALNFLNVCYFNTGIYAQYNGEYMALCRHVEKFIKLLRKCKVEPIFVLDGCHPPQKLRTQLDRSRDRFQTCRQLFLGASNADADSFDIHILPQLSQLCMLEALDRLGVSHVTTDFECDQVALCLAIRLNCPLLSNDSDMFITAPTLSSQCSVFILPFALFEQKATLFQGKCLRHCASSACCYIPCHKFLPNGPGLANLSAVHRPLFASLMGNDYISPASFANVIPGGRNKAVPTGKPTGKRRFAQLRQLRDWLCGFDDNLREPVQRLLSRIPIKSRANLTKALIISLDQYAFDPLQTCNYYIDYVTSVSGMVVEEHFAHLSLAPSSDTSCTSGGSSSFQEQLLDLLQTNNIKMDRENQPITAYWPPKLIEAFRLGRLSPILLESLYNAGVVFNCGVEVIPHKRSIHACGKPIRELLLEFLLSAESLHDGVSRSTGLRRRKEAPYVVEYYRMGNTACRAFKLFLPSISTQLPSENFDEFLSEKLKLQLDYTLKPECAVGLAAVLTFWYRTQFAPQSAPLTCAMLSLSGIALSSVYNCSGGQFSAKLLCKHYSACAAWLSSLTGKGKKMLHVGIVHQYGEAQIIYSSFVSLLNLVKCLAPSQTIKLSLPSVTSMFPSGQLFHHLTNHLESIPSDERFAYMANTIFPRLLHNQTSVSYNQPCDIFIHFMNSVGNAIANRR